LTFHPSHELSRRAARAAACLALVLHGLLTAGPAAAAETCGRKVINDWYDNGRVDGTYPLHCYDDAIEALPRDVRDYSSAKEDIQRALQYRLQGKPDPGGADPSPDDAPGKTTATPPGSTTPGGGSGTGPNKPGDDGGTVAGGDVDTTAAESVPVPLLILGGLALLLVAAGSVGYLARRLQARRMPPPAV
jgi:hypothetical protein